MLDSTEKRAAAKLFGAALSFTASLSRPIRPVYFTGSKKTLRNTGLINFFAAERFSHTGVVAILPAFNQHSVVVLTAFGGPEYWALRQISAQSGSQTYSAFSFSVNIGSNCFRSATARTSEISPIGASLSVLMARTNSDFFIPARCCMAPEIPQAT